MKTKLKMAIQMDDLRGFFKNVLVNFCENVDVECPSVRMSDLANTSITSTTSDQANNCQNNEYADPPNNPTDLHSTEILNNSKFTKDQEPDQQPNLIYNKINKVDEVNEKKIEELNKNADTMKHLKLIIPKTSLRIVNDINKIQTPDVKRNSTLFIFPVADMDDISINKQNHMVISRENLTTNQFTVKQKQIRPIMGKNALLKRANIEKNDSVIVQDIVLDKYNPVLTHYVTKMHRRRMSKSRLTSSCEDDAYSDGALSSTPSCSPMSISSIGSAQQGFSFPSIEEVDHEHSKPTAQQQVRRNSCQRTESFKYAVVDNTHIETPNINDTIHSCSVISNEGTTFSDYDPEKFLSNALGDMTSLSESGICNNEMTHKYTSTKCSNSTIGSTDVSLLVSKLSSIYSSLKNGIRKRRSSLKANQFVPIGEQPLKNFTDYPQLETLKKQLAIQNEIMFQVSKALVYCRSSKEFLYSVEHIEAEKILLVALITKDALTSEINAIEFNNYLNPDDPRIKGEVQMSSIRFLPKENNIDLINEINEDFINEYFLVVLSCGGKVLASHVMALHEKGLLEVEKSFAFKDLSTCFEITLAVYSMLAKDRSYMSQDTVNCPSPKNLFQLHRDSKKSYRVVSDVPYIKTSAFRLLGRTCIRNSNLSRSKQETFKLYDAPIYSRLSSTFTAKITSNIRLDVKISGFLTVGIENEQSCTIWNRRWCVLENSYLKYWNYPSEESALPLGSVDLSFCIEQNICLAERSSCARSRTLLIPIKNGNNVKKYLLSADSTKDMEIWKKELNFVVRSLTTWHCMN